LGFALLSGCAAYRSELPPRPDDASRMESGQIARPDDAGQLAGGAAVPAPVSADPAKGQIDPAEPKSDDRVSRAQVVLTTPASRDPDTSSSFTPSIPQPSEERPIDLPTALRLADSVNPVIGAARARIEIALADLTAARALLLPMLNVGTNYHNHTGVLQRSSGEILSTSNQSLYVGGGAQAIGPGSVEIPAVNVSVALVDAVYEPLAARKTLDVSRFDASATANTVLLEVSTLYQDLHRAGALLASRRRSEADAAEVEKITSGFARAGQGRQADADRARSERKLVGASIRRAEEEVARASAALCRRLHLDPSIRLLPSGDPLAVLMLIDPAADEEALIATAIRRRPEVGARSAAVAVAETRLRQEKARPFLPTIWIGGSGGAFGGGSNLYPPTLGNFGGRTDFDAMAYWTLRNFGLGNLAIQKRRRGEVGAAASENARTISRVREEVASARADAIAQHERIVLAVDEMAASERGFHQDLERARQVRGLPIELLNNLDLLIKSREDLIRTVIGFNQAQLRLFVALGTPPPLEIAATRVPRAAEEATGDRDQAAEGGGGPPRDVASEVREAHQASLRAAGEYEREQARLIESLAPGKPLASRDVRVAELKALAEAHRKVVVTQAEYHQAVWKLLDKPAPEPQPGSVQATKPPEQANSVETR